MPQHVTVQGALPSPVGLPPGHTVIINGVNHYLSGGAWVQGAGPGGQGESGPSAYQIAVTNGFVGTEADWLTSLGGPSAYQLAVADGFVGTRADWLASLEGPAGPMGGSLPHQFTGHVLAAGQTAADVPVDLPIGSIVFRHLP